MADLLRIVGLMVGLFGLIAGIFGLLYFWQVVQTRRLHTRWEAEGRHIRFGPVSSAVAVLPVRQKDNTGSSFGSVAIVDDRLTYTGTYGRSHNVALTREQVRWIGIRAMTPPTSPDKIPPQRVELYFTGARGWENYRFNLRKWDAFSRALHEWTGLPLVELKVAGNVFEVTAVNATRMTQNIYGQWHDEITDKLHFAPDRMIFAWQDSIPYAALRQLDLYDKHEPLEAINPFAQDLLRIEYVPEGSDQPQVVGFQLAGARKWGDHLAAASGVSLTVHEGRKKKSG